MTLAAALCPVKLVNAKDPDDAPTTIARLEKLYSQTFVTGDSAAADRMLASDFVGLDSKGKPFDRAAVLAEVRGSPHQTSAKITSLKVRVYGDTAISLGFETDTGPGPSDVAKRVWMDTWVRTPEGWRMAASTEVPTRLEQPPG